MCDPSHIMNEFELNILKLTPNDNQLFFLILLIHVSRRQQKSDLKIDLCPSYLLAKHYEIHGKWIVAQICKVKIYIFMYFMNK